MCSKTLSSPSLPPVRQSRTGPTYSSKLFRSLASRFSRRSHLHEPRYKLFWQTMSIAASMLMFGALRPSMNQMTTGGAAPSVSIYSSSKELHRTELNTPLQQTKVSKARERQLHSMAKDFTIHSNLRAPGVSTVGESEATNRAHGNVIPTRVVFN